jgi:hypothetical protein
VNNAEEGCEEIPGTLVVVNAGTGPDEVGSGGATALTVPVIGLVYPAEKKSRYSFPNNVVLPIT